MEIRMQEMKRRKLVIFGYGFSAEAIRAQVNSDFAEICGTSRSPDKVHKLREQGLEAVVFDGEQTGELVSHLRDATHFLVSIAPGEVDPVLSAFPELSDIVPNLEWIGYLSTVGVYGDHDGEWVDEETATRPVSTRSVQRVAAEEAWSRFSRQTGAPLAIFRLSGIYGPGRNWFVNIEKGRSRRLVKQGQVFNRIHRDDIGLAVSLAMQKQAAGIFNITDDEPAPPQDVVTFAHFLMGKTPPPEQEFETADISAMARSFYGENKRVSNQKSKQQLGMVYQWPNYRMALERMWSEGSWR